RPWLPRRYESAGVAKIAINVFLAASVSAANTLAQLCEAVGADWAEVVPALRSDRRIGPHAYLSPGLGIGGGNLERDLVTLTGMADELGVDASVPRAFLANSRRRRDWALRAVHERVLPVTPDPVLAILGIAYKPGTDSTRNSPALPLLEALQPFEVRFYDPQAVAGDARPHLTRAESALEACAGADAVLLMTPWPEFAQLDPSELAATLRGRIVIDPYGVLPSARCQQAGL